MGDAAGSESRLRVLLLDHAKILSEITGLMKDISECELHACSLPSEADSRLIEVKPDLLLVDHDFLGNDGLKLVGKAFSETGTAHVIVSLPQGQTDLEREYMKAGATHVVAKGVGHPGGIVPILKKILIEMVEEREFVVSVLSSPGRDFLSQGPSSDVFSILSAFDSGQVVLHYRIIRPLGEGGMAEVYLAEDLQQNRPVALKVLPLSAYKNDTARRRFKREASLVSSLNHPNIVRVFGIEESQGLPFLVMEYLQGDLLSEFIAHGPLPLKLLFEIGAQVADGLAAAHAVGLIHRDIKPANIMILANGQVKLLDFGLAKRIILFGERGSDLKTMTHLTAMGVPVGTVHYMAPEQTRGEELDFRSDIFSLGTVLYEACTGRKPFEGNTIF